MARPVVKKAIKEINKATMFIMGVRKFGKTTLWADIIKEKFNGDVEKGVLVSCGMEHGTNMIDNINTVHVNTYKELAELIKWLCDTKDKEHKIEMVCFDSAEELFGILEKEIIRKYCMENPTKKCASIQSAYGGFNRGVQETAKLFKELMNKLYNAGITPSAIGHTKLKTVRDKSSLDDEGYQKLGSSLPADYDGAVGDCFDIIVTGLVDREIEERGQGDSTKRYVKETERRLYFRGNEIVDAGGRLKPANLPDYIVFDSENMGRTFIDTVETALRGDKVAIKPSTVASPKKEEVVEPVEEEIDEPIVEEEVVETPIEENADDDFDLFDDEPEVEESDYPEDLLGAIKSSLTTADKKATAKNYLVSAGKKLSDLDDTELKELYDKVK